MIYAKVTPFSIACEAGHVDTVKVLMDDNRVSVDCPDAFKVCKAKKTPNVHVYWLVYAGNAILQEL